VRALPAPGRLQGSRAALRLLEARDHPAIVAAFHEDPQLGIDLGVERDPDEALLAERLAEAPTGLAAGRFVELAIVAADGDDVLGTVSVFDVDWQHEHAEIGFWLMKEARGRGIATEAVALAVAWVFELGLHRVEMRTLPRLTHVIALGERLGFQAEGIARERNLERGVRLDTLTLAVLRPEWDARRPPV
jgi:RimJ/RimL family protein N-acetyltransferase